MTDPHRSVTRIGMCFWGVVGMPKDALQRSLFLLLPLYYSRALLRVIYCPYAGPASVQHKDYGAPQECSQRFGRNAQGRLPEVFFLFILWSRAPLTAAAPKCAVWRALRSIAHLGVGPASDVFSTALLLVM